MFVLTITVNGSTRTEERSSGAAHISAWKSLKSLGYTVKVNSAFEATATL